MSEELIARLRKRMEEDRQCAANSQVIVDLLEPQMSMFQEYSKEGGWNTYAVRMAVGHRNSVKRDTQYADDLKAAIALLEASPPAKPAPVDALALLKCWVEWSCGQQGPSPFHDTRSFLSTAQGEGA